MKRLDVVYELVLELLQSTRNRLVQVGIHEWIEGQVSAPPIASFCAVDAPCVQLKAPGTFSRLPCRVWGGGAVRKRQRNGKKSVHCYEWEGGRWGATEGL